MAVPEPPVPIPSPDGKKLVLLVEDDPAHAALITRAFADSNEPFTLHLAPTLRHAREQIHLHPPALVISDLRLPDGQGMELVKEMNARPGAPPVILMTSQGNENVAVEAIRSGALDYIVKSSSAFQEMPHIARRALRQWESLVQQKRAQDAIHSSGERLHTIFNSVYDAILILSPEGRILDVNNKALRLLSTTREALLNAPWRINENTPENPIPRLAELWSQALQNGRLLFECPTRSLHARDHSLDTEVFVRRLTLSGQVVLLVNVRDITERKQAERAAENSRLAADQANRARSDLLANMARELEVKVQERTLALQQANERLKDLLAEKEAFFHLIAHDLKNPLSAIRGYAEILCEETQSLPPDLADIPEKITHTSRRAADLLTTLLDVHSLESGGAPLEIIPLDLLEVLNDSLAGVRPLADRKYQPILLDLPPQPLPRALADRASLRSIFDNILSNAIKYSPTASPIQVTLLPLPPGMLRCTVRDYGQGLTAQDQARLFQRFARLSARPTGGEHSTGIGLFYVRKLTEAMSGVITCHSIPGQGATFQLDLPAAP